MKAYPRAARGSTPVACATERDESGPSGSGRPAPGFLPRGPGPGARFPRPGPGPVPGIVQVSARRSKADAQASFRSLQSKFPRQLGGRTAIFLRADLGAKGIYYRAMVGPFGSADEAGRFCSGYKAAGGQCIIQRN